MSKKNIIIFSIICSIIVLIGLISVTYAYYQATIAWSNSTPTITASVPNTGSLALTFNGSATVTGTDIYPGWTKSVTFSVKNTGTLPVRYNLEFINVSNTVSPTNVVYSLSCSGTNAPATKSNVVWPIVVDGTSYKVVNTNYANTTSTLQDWATPGKDAGNWTVSSTSGLSVGNNVALKCTDSTRNADVYILGTVKSINSATAIYMISNGMIDKSVAWTTGSGTIQSNILINAGVTHSCTFTALYKNATTSQTHELGKSFKGTITISAVQMTESNRQ